MLDAQKQIVFSGAGCTYNWHKHPRGITHPSGGDIREAIRDIELQYPGRKSYLYTIAVPVSRIQESQNSNVLCLGAREYGGFGNYELRSYILNYENREMKPMKQLKIRILE